jgi:hypothetical protein
MAWLGFGPAEDVELYGRLTAAGTTIAYVEGAVATVLNEAKLETSATQRRRWSAGRWLASRRYLIAVLRSSRIGARQKLDAVAELLSPGPVEHLIIATVGLAVAGLAPIPGARLLLGLLAVGLARPAIYTALAMRRHPDPKRALAALVMLPVYVAWRFAVSLSALGVFLTRKWEKTKRVTLGSHVTP